MKYKNLTVGSRIKTKGGDGVITKIGNIHHSMESNGVGWAMLTLTMVLGGEVGYAPAREDELAHDA